MSNISVENFHSLIVSALSIDKTTRSKAESSLSNLRQGSPDTYIQITCAYIKDASRSFTDQNKQLACTILRQALLESSVSHSILKNLQQNTIAQLIQTLTDAFSDNQTSPTLFAAVTSCISQLGSSVLTLGFPF